MTRERTVRVRDIGAGVTALEGLFRGSADLWIPTAPCWANAQVVVACGAAIRSFRGETRSFFADRRPGGIESFYRHVVISEYRDGVLFNVERCRRADPIHPLPEGVRDSAQRGVENVTLVR